MKVDSPKLLADSPIDSREFKLRYTEEDYRALIDQAPDAIFIADRKFRVILVNTHGCEMSGYSQAEVLRKSIFDFMVPEDVAANPLRFDELNEGKTVVSERKLKRKDGTVVPVEVSSKLLSDGRLQSIVRDLSRRKRAEKERKKLDAALRRGAQRFRALIEHTHDAIALFGADGAVLYASPSTTRVMGYDPEELLQRNMMEFVRPDWQGKIRETVAEALRQPGVGIPTEGYVRNKAGEYRFLEGTFTNLLDEPSVGAIVNNYRDITERKQAEEALRESEARYARAVNGSNDGIWEWNPVTGEDYLSPRWKQWLGYEDHELPNVQETFFNQIHPDDQARVSEAIRAHFEERKPYQIELRMRCKSGEYRWFYARGQAIWDEQGKPLRMTGSIADISPRKDAEAALRENQEKLALAMRTARMGSWYYDLESGRFEADAAGMELHGFAAGEPITSLQQGSAHIHQDDTAEIQRRFAHAVETKGIYENEYRVVLPEGGIRWIYSLGRVPEGSPYLIGMVQDITERKRAEERLFLSEQKFADAFQTSPAGITVTRIADGKFIDVNEAFLRLFEFTREEVIGHTSLELNIFAPDERAKMIQAQIESGGLRSTELMARTKSGKLINILFSSRPIQWEGETRHITTLIDITDRKQAEQELARVASFPLVNPHPITELDQAGRIRFANPSARCLFPDLGDGSWSHPWLAGLEPVLSDFQARGTGVTEREVQIGETWYAQTLFYVAESRCVRIYGYQITDRKQTEVKLRESEARLRLSAEAANVGLWDWDLKTNKVYFSPEWKNQIGYRDDELSNDFSEWESRVHPDDLAPTMEKTRAFLSNPDVRYEAEFRLRHKDGSYRWIYTHADVLRDTDGKPVRMLGCHIDITERKRAEAALREREQELRLFTQATNDMFWNWDFATDHVERSMGFERAFGYSAAEVASPIGWWEERLHPDDHQRVLAEFQTALQRGDKTCAYEYRFRRHDGSYAMISDRAYFVRDQRGQAVRALGAMTDITERKQADDLLRQSEKKYRDLVETAHDLIWAVDAQGTITFMNQAAREIYGYEPEELIGRSYLDLLSPEERVRQGAALPELLTSGERFVLGQETEVMDRDGNRHTLMANAVILFDEQGNAIGTMGTSADVTERKQAEKALRESEDQYRDLVDNMRDLVCTHDLQGRLLFVNRASAELLGYEPRELLERNLREILDPSNRHMFEDYLKTIQAESKASGLMLVRTRAGDARLWDYHNTLRAEGTAAPTVRGLARDITERKRAEEALLASRDQLRALSARVQTAREEEGARIAREIHDELGGVLTGLKWDLEGFDKILSASGNGGKVSAAAEKISAMTGLIDTTIDKVRRISSELRPGVLDDLGLVSAIEWQAQQFQQRTGIECRCEAGLEIDLSREQATAIFRVFQEVLTNVLRHARATRVEIKMTEADDEIVLEVKDNGCGISELEKQNKQSLGLLGMHERIQLIGGEIDITGVKGSGTSVVVRVPLG